MCTGIQEPPGRGRVVLVSCITYSINAASNGGFMDPIITMHDSHNPIKACLLFYIEIIHDKNMLVCMNMQRPDFLT